MRRLVIAAALILVTPGVALASNDPFFAQQWGLAKVGAEQAWATGKGAGITIAVVDTGVDPSHEDLAGKLVAGYDFVSNDSDPRDEHSHGTHVAGIAAAITGNARGVAGTAPDAKIMPIRVLDEDGEGGSDDIEEGIRWAADRGARVINLSLGELTPIRLVLGSSIQEGINYAWSRGALPVVAAGNDLIFPSGYSGVNAIAVAATDQNDGRPVYSNGTGDAKWGMAAPGNQIISTLPGSKYGSNSGTSMATPHVAGAAAVLMGLGLNRQQTVDRLLSSAKDIGPAGHDGSFGSGRLDMSKAVAGLGKPTATGGSTSTNPSGGTTKGKSNPTSAAVNSPSPALSPTPQESPQAQEATDNPTQAQAKEEKGERTNSVLVNLIVGGLLVAGAAGVVLWQRLRAKPG